MNTVTILTIYIVALNVIAALLAFALWRLTRPLRLPPPQQEFRFRTTIFCGNRRFTV